MDQKVDKQHWWTRVLNFILRRKQRRQDDIEMLRKLEREVSSAMIPEAPLQAPPVPAAEPEVKVELPPTPAPQDEVSEPPKVKPKPVPEVAQQEPPVEEVTPKRKYETRFIHLRRELANKTEIVLDLLENIKAGRNQHQIPEVLDNLYGCDFLLWDPDLFDKLKGADKWSALDPVGIEDEIAQVVWPIDFAVALPRVTANETVIIELMRVMSVEPKEVRGQVRQIYPKMVRLDRARVALNGMWDSAHDYAGLAGKQWVLIDELVPFKTVDKSYRHFLQALLPKLMSNALTERYQWHVAFGTSMVGGPRLLLPTNPSDCLTLFNNRTLTEGQTRRQALRHWVEEHYADRNDTGLSFICAHLRGNTLFSWCGLNCELFVSEYDLEKNELFKAQAKEWRARRKHNRVRVRFKK